MQARYTGLLKRIMTMILATFLLSGCFSNKTCCENQTPESDEAAYCKRHQEVVRKYVESTLDADEKRVRLERFKQFYSRIKYCSNVRCIEEIIYSDDTPRSLSQRYTLEHEIAEREVFLENQFKKGSLILCGFSTALEKLEVKLAVEGQ